VSLPADFASQHAKGEKHEEAAYRNFYMQYPMVPLRTIQVIAYCGLTAHLEHILR